jgi:hypothetical protein
MPKQPSFGERVGEMRVAAEQLEVIASQIVKISYAIREEAVRMAAAEKRFSERRGQNDKRRTRE